MKILLFILPNRKICSLLRYKKTAMMERGLRLLNIRLDDLHDTTCLNTTVI